MSTASTVPKKRGGKRASAGRKFLEGQAKVSPPKSPDPVVITWADARTANEYWKAQLAEQEFKKRAGELLERAEVERGNATLFAKISQTVRSWPDNVERTAGLSPEQADALEQMVGGLCDSIKNQIQEFGGVSE